MRALLNFDEKHYQAVPIGVLGSILVFCFVMLLEIVLGGLVYGASKLISDAYLQSVTMNLGTWLTKGLILVVLWELSGIKKNGKSPIFKNDVGTKPVLKLLPLVLLFVLSFRLFFDPLIGQWVVKTFGIDEMLIEGMSTFLKAPLLGMIYLVLIGPTFEEIVYRGFIFSGMLRKGKPFMVAAVMSSLFFAVAHFNVAQGVNAFFLGMVAAWVYYMTGNIKYNLLLHILNNLMALFVSDPMDKLIQSNPLYLNIGITAIGLGVLIGSGLYFSKKCKELSEESSKPDLI